MPTLGQAEAAVSSPYSFANLSNHLLGHFLTHWHAPQGRRRWIGLAALFILIVAIAALVYATGGIKYVYAHAMYLPILLAGAMFGCFGGIITGLFAGLALGPSMPIDTASGEMQETVNWLFRVGLFALVGAVTGLLVNTTARLAGQDPASGIPSQLPLRHHLAERAKLLGNGRGEPFSLILVVLENYSELVNTFGPEIGLKLIRGLSSRLTDLGGNCLPVYHLHGERFALVCPATEVDQIQSQLRARAGDPIQADGIPLYTNLTLGRADCPAHSDKAESLIQLATIAADTATGRGEIDATYETRFDHTNRENLVLLSDFSQAVSRSELRLHYQPKLDLRTSEITGIEALVRWQHPQHGLLPPGRFILQVERTHLIHLLTPWVLGQALQDLECFHGSGAQWRVAINLSTRNLQDPDLLQTIEQCIKESHARPDQLDLEVTESALLTDPAQARAVLRKLRDWGFGVAIDDFGVGQTSLAYLKTIPANDLKIDRTFIRQLRHDTADQRIVESIALLGHKLGMGVVAEGVEDGETLALLKGLGCDVAQGYFICRPQPATELAGFRFSAGGSL